MAYALLTRSSGAGSDRRPLVSQPAAALGWWRGPNRAATAAPIERSKGKKSYDIMSQTRKEGMPSCSLPKGGESRQSRMERSKATETTDTEKPFKVG